MAKSFVFRWLFSFIFFVLFATFSYSFIVVWWDAKNIKTRLTQVSANFLSIESDESNTINMGSITSIIIDESDIADVQTTFLEYNVQAWDNLSSIASQFWTTVDAIKRVNNLDSSSLRIGQKLFITSVEWFIYQIEESTYPVIFASQYNINLDDLLSVNNIKNKLMIINKWEEIFVPLSREEGIKRWLIQASLAGLQQDRPKPVPERPSARSSRILIGNIPSQSQQSSPRTSEWSQNGSTPSVRTNNQHIVSQWAYSSRIWNGFAAWFCTRYAAVKSPWAFPFISEGRQYKSWHGDAKLWYDRAKAAWFKVSSTPSVWAIVVLSRAQWWYASAWHVGIVVDVDWNQKRFMIEDMNYYGLWIVTRRWIYMDDSMTKATANSAPIIWFIPKQQTPQRILDEIQ